MASTRSRSIDWLAALAGGLAAVATQLVLSVLGAGLGPDIFTTASGFAPGPLSVGFADLTDAARWLLVGEAAIALFVGGCVAGRLSGQTSRWLAGLEGLMAWALAAVVILGIAVSPARGVFAPATGVVGSSAAAAVQDSQTIADLPNGARPDVADLGDLGWREQIGASGTYSASDSEALRADRQEALVWMATALAIAAIAAAIGGALLRSPAYIPVRESEFDKRSVRQRARRRFLHQT